MANIFPRSSNWLPLKVLVILMVLGGAVTAGMWYYFTPKYTRVGYEPIQPNPFPHDIHVKQLGMDIELLHDAHEQLDPIQAARLAKDLEPFRLFFLEDPLMPEHRESWPILRQASVTPLAIGEIFTSRWDCLPLFMNRWIDFIRIKPLHVGGITEARKILTLAEPFNVRSAFHGAADIGPIAQSASVSLQAVIPNFGVQEWTSYAEATHEVLPGACEVRDGYALPNERPGLGMDIDEEKAARYPYQRAFMPLVRRADGSVHVY